MLRSMGLLVVMLATSGCWLGRNEVIFVTRTNVAVDFDVKPMNTAIAYKRDELVLQPVDKNGNTLPVLTSVGVQAAPLSFGANHSFATGDAALVMSRYLGSGADLKHVDVIGDQDIGDLRAKGNWIHDEGREGYIFTTDTSLGLAVSWDGAAVPTAVALGYKRKELALVPLKHPYDEKQKKEDTSKLSLTSLIATANSGSKVAAPGESGVVVGQTFATGWAATYLASHPGIRAALGPAVIPNFDKAMAEQERLDKDAEAKNKPLFDQLKHADAIGAWFEDPSRTQAEKDQLLKDAIAAGLAPAGTSPDRLRNELVKTAGQAKTHPQNADDFKALADPRGITIK